MSENKIVKLERITSGVSNENYRIRYNGKPAFMRMGDHLEEFKILSKLQNYSWVPNPIEYTDEYFITEWVEGSELTEPNPTLVAKITSELQKVSIDDIPHFDPYTELINMMSLSIPIEFSQYFDKWITPINLYIPIICHRDIHRENILENKNKYYLIDWEFTCTSHHLTDLASYTITEALSLIDATKLFDEYHKLSSVEPNWDEYKKLCRIMGLYWSIWFISKGRSINEAKQYFNKWATLDWLHSHCVLY